MNEGNDLTCRLADQATKTPMFFVDMGLYIDRQ